MTTESENKLITREEYISDIKARWKIHTKEWNEFLDDVKKLLAFIQPYVVKAIDKVKGWIGKFTKKQD